MMPQTFNELSTDDLIRQRQVVLRRIQELAREAALLEGRRVAIEKALNARNPEVAA